MPVVEELLTPINGPNPSGQDLRYTPLYEKIKEARREDDEAPQGDWARERKRADFALVVRLCTEALATRSKDLQLAAWLVEAQVRQQGIRGLHEGLELICSLVTDFWETLYPALEDDDAEFRATPLDWIGCRLDNAIREVPLAKNGFGWFKYRESRTVGYEQDAEGSEAKQQARAAAIEDGKLTAEEFDAAFDATPKAFYAQLAADIDSTLTKLAELKSVCDERFKSVSPNFSPLQDSLETIRGTVRSLLQKKCEQEPDASPEMEEPQPEVSEEEVSVIGADAEPSAPVPVVRRKTQVSATPNSPEEARQNIIRLAQYLRREEPASPVSYLVVRALEWGELRRRSDISSADLDPPPSELRKELKRLAGEGSWEELLNAAETAASSFGRGWLDVHRYVVQACTELGSEYERVSLTVESEVRSLLASYPGLPDMSLADDTPTANSDTKEWLHHLLPPTEAPSPEEVQDVPPPVPAAVVCKEEGGEVQAPDAYDLARQESASGRPQNAIEILNREVAHERSGRAKFQRKLQLAEICMTARYESVAHPILDALVKEIDDRQLEEWEAPDLIVRVLVLAFHCIQRLGIEPDQKQKLYGQICRLDPSQALTISM